MTSQIESAKDAAWQSGERSSEPGGSIPRNTAASEPRVAILSPVVPPMPSGQSRVLGMLLQGIAEGRIVFLFDRESPMAEAEKLPAEYIRLRPARDRLLRLPRVPVFHQLNAWLGMTHVVFRRAREIQQALSPNPPEVLIACTASLVDIPAGWLAARRLGIPFFEYVFDDYVYQWRRVFQRIFARFWERRVLRDAAGVFATNELLAESYLKRYAVTPIIVHNPASPESFVEISKPTSIGGDRLKILYTGSVYDAQSDAIQNLVAALERCASKAELHIYTRHTDKDLRKHGIVGPVIRHDHVGHSEIIDIQKRADILFLPLSFRSRFPEAVRTAAPGKMGEYLASGRPILVHAPADSHISQFFTRKGCGIVVDKPDPDALAEAIARLDRDLHLRSQIVLKAKEAAQDFSLARSRDTFWSAVNSAPRRNECS